MQKITKKWGTPNMQCPVAAQSINVAQVSNFLFS
jgi:hypothetical protein